ncbi:MAG TPA: hypothetical protein VGA18_00465 [Rhodothermales bacterium]
MHRNFYAVLALLGAATVAQAQGISARSTAESLRGLRGVHVVVQELIPEVRSAGLTADGIKSAVEDRLAKRGIPVLGLGELTMDPRGPALLIQVDFVAADPVYFYNSQVQFFQNVTVDIGEGEVPVFASASTWQTSKVDKSAKFRLPTLAQDMAAQVDQFIEAYLTMNLPVPEPVEAEEETAEMEAEMEKTPEEL